jgi:hypothetical protein
MNGAGYRRRAKTYTGGVLLPRTPTLQVSFHLTRQQRHWSAQPETKKLIHLLQYGSYYR